MKPKVFSKVNVVLGEGQSGVIPLPVHHDPETKTIISVWQPNPMEKEALAMGHCVVLTVHGDQHPLVSLGVEQELDTVSSH